MDRQDPHRVKRATPQRGSLCEMLVLEKDEGVASLMGGLVWVVRGRAG